MDSLKKDILELGAIVQRDRETYAIAPHIPGGITDADTLMKLAEVAKKYQVQAIKVTSAQRIALVGIREDDIESAWNDLGMDKGAAIGMCVRSVKVCPGTTFCKRAKQDSVALGLELDKRYHGHPLPGKFKIGVSGCPNSCAENAVKDLGFMGTKDGYTIMVGGNAAGRPRLAEPILMGKSHEEALEIADRVINLYSTVARKGQRLGTFIDAIGVDLLKNYLEAPTSELAGRQEQVSAQYATAK